MRPTDENQAGSRRPNLMSSSRRTSGEIHILAMLDGKTTGPLSTRFLALPAPFWYGVAGVAVCVLLAALAWLAHTPAPAPDRGIEAENAAIGAAPAVPAPAVVRAPPADDNAVLAVTALPPGHETAPPPAGGATIVDMPTPTVSPASSPIQSSAASLTAADAAAPVPAPAAPPRSASTAPPPTLHLSPTRAPSTARTAARAAPARGAAPEARSQAPASARIAAHASASRLSPRPPNARPPAQHHAGAMPASSLARSDTPPRTRRQPGAPKTAQPIAVDTDVALISAIIQHTGPQADAPDPAALPCAERVCGPRMPNRQ